MSTSIGSATITDIARRYLLPKIMDNIFMGVPVPPPHPDGPMHGPHQWEVPDGMACPCCNAWIDLSDRGYDY